MSRALDIIQEKCIVEFEDAETCSISYRVPPGMTVYIDSDVYHEKGLTIDRITDADLTFINGKEYNLNNVDFFEIR